MRSTSLGLFRPGSSPVHRLRPGTKLLVLVALGGVSVLAQHWWWVAGVLVAGALLAYRLAGFGPRLWWAQLRPLWPLLAFTAVAQALTSGWQRAAGVTGSVVLLVTMAALVTLTTPTAALVDTVVRLSGPLARFRVDPERVGLFLMVGIRCVPLVADLARQVREAQIARRATTSTRAFVVPLVVRSLREADALGEALIARGVDD